MENTKSEIRRQREAMRLTLRETARRSGIAFNHLSRVERGLASLSVSNMLRLADALRVSPEWLARQLGKLEEERNRP